MFKSIVSKVKSLKSNETVVMNTEFAGIGAAIIGITVALVPSQAKLAILLGGAAIVGCGFWALNRESIYKK
jgi:hypothetical protein